MDPREQAWPPRYLQAPATPSSWLSRALRLLVWLTLLVVGLMFSLVAFAVLFVGGLMLWAYLAWKTRKLRQKLQEQGLPGAGGVSGWPEAAQADVEAGAASARDRQASQAGAGRIIEGEVIRPAAQDGPGAKPPQP